MLIFFFFNDTATTEIYTLSLHDALPICVPWSLLSKLSVMNHTINRRTIKTEKLISSIFKPLPLVLCIFNFEIIRDRKSTRLNSSHANISYAVFCLKKKNQLSNTSSHTNI